MTFADGTGRWMLKTKYKYKLVTHCSLMIHYILWWSGIFTEITSAS